MSSVRFKVLGRVQNVGFRVYTCNAASSCGVNGEVWNCRDGSVEGIASGDSLDRFLELLESGPGVVTMVRHHDVPDQAFEGFVIVSTR